MVLLNTVPLSDEKRINKIRMLSVASLFAEAMGNIYSNNSVSKMFD
jgi:ribose-phosphate pyrophosphokinase